MPLINKTGGCTTLDHYPQGLFVHDGGLYVARAKWSEKRKFREVKVLRCSDGEVVWLGTCASVYPMGWESS